MRKLSSGADYLKEGAEGYCAFRYITVVQARFGVPSVVKDNDTGEVFRTKGKLCFRDTLEAQEYTYLFRSHFQSAEKKWPQLAAAIRLKYEALFDELMTASPIGQNVSCEKLGALVGKIENTMVRESQGKQVTLHSR